MANNSGWPYWIERDYLGNYKYIWIKVIGEATTGDKIHIYFDSDASIEDSPHELFPVFAYGPDIPSDWSKDSSVHYSIDGNELVMTYRDGFYKKLPIQITHKWILDPDCYWYDAEWMIFTHFSVTDTDSSYSECFPTLSSSTYTQSSNAGGDSTILYMTGTYSDIYPRIWIGDGSTTGYNITSGFSGSTSLTLNMHYTSEIYFRPDNKVQFITWDGDTAIDNRAYTVNWSKPLNYLRVGFFTYASNNSSAKTTRYSWIFVTEKPDTNATLDKIEEGEWTIKGYTFRKRATITIGSEFVRMVKIPYSWINDTNLIILPVDGYYWKQRKRDGSYKLWLRVPYIEAGKSKKYIIRANFADDYVGGDETWKFDGNAKATFDSNNDGLIVGNISSTTNYLHRLNKALTFNGGYVQLPAPGKYFEDRSTNIYLKFKTTNTSEQTLATFRHIVYVVNSDDPNKYYKWLFQTQIVLAYNTETNKPKIITKTGRTLLEKPPEDTNNYPFTEYTKEQDIDFDIFDGIYHVLRFKWVSFWYSSGGNTYLSYDIYVDNTQVLGYYELAESNFSSGYATLGDTFKSFVLGCKFFNETDNPNPSTGETSSFFEGSIDNVVYSTNEIDYDDYTKPSGNSKGLYNPYMTFPGIFVIDRNYTQDYLWRSKWHVKDEGFNGFTDVIYPQSPPFDGAEYSGQNKGHALWLPVNVADDYDVITLARIGDTNTDYSGVFSCVYSDPYTAGNNAHGTATVLLMTQYNSNELRWWAGDGSTTGYNVGYGSTGVYLDRNTWYEFKISYRPDGFDIYVNDSLKVSKTANWAKELRFLRLGFFANGSQTDMQETEYVYSFVVKRLDTQPSVNIEQIENYAWLVEITNTSTEDLIDFNVSFNDFDSKLFYLIEPIEEKENISLGENF